MEGEAEKAERGGVRGGKEQPELKVRHKTRCLVVPKMTS